MKNLDDFSNMLRPKLKITKLKKMSVGSLPRKVPAIINRTFVSVRRKFIMAGKGRCTYRCKEEADNWLEVAGVGWGGGGFGLVAFIVNGAFRSLSSPFSKTFTTQRRNSFPY